MSSVINAADVRKAEEAEEANVTDVAATTT